MDFLSTPVSVTQLLSRLKEQEKTSSKAFTLPLSEEDCKTALSASYRSIVVSHGLPYDESPSQKGLVSELSHFLVSPGYRRGIIMMGVPGCGKTTAVLAIQRLIEVMRLADPVYSDASHFVRAGLNVVDAKDIVRCYEHAYDEKSAFARCKSDSMLAIDDLGEEQRGKMEFGQMTFPVNELVEYRYSRSLFTIITTNLYFEAGQQCDGDGKWMPGLTEIYGRRFTDRLREMMFPIVFDRDSYRAKMK